MGIANTKKEKYGVFDELDNSFVELDKYTSVLEEKFGDIRELAKYDLQSFEEWMHSDTSFIKEIKSMNVEFDEANQCTYSKEYGYYYEKTDIDELFEKMEKEAFDYEFECMTENSKAVTQSGAEFDWEIEIKFKIGETYIIYFKTCSVFVLNTDDEDENEE